MTFFDKINAQLISLDKNKKGLIHVSGGPDSIFLLYYLSHFAKEQFASLKVLAINYGFRPEAKEEVAYVKDCCEKWGIEDCFVYEPSIHVKEGVSIQKIARELRLKKSDELARQWEIDYIFLAHHLDDFLETMFLKMNREASLASISQFRPHYGKIIRPLLDVSKNEILSYLDEHKIRYYLDQSNSKSVYARNKFRLEVFPHLDEAFPAWRNRFYKSFQLFQEGFFLLEKTLLISGVFKNFEGGFLLCSSYYEGFSFEEKSLILHILLKRNFPELKMTRDFLFYLVKEIEKRNFFIIQKEGEKKWVFDHDFVYVLKEEKIVLDIEVEKEIVWNNERFFIHDLNKNKQRFIENNKKDGNFLLFMKKPLTKITLRNRLHGDKLYIFGLGHKKLKKIFNELHLPRLVREQSLILEDDAGINFVFFKPKNIVEVLLQEKKLEKSFLERGDLKEETAYRYVLEII